MYSLPLTLLWNPNIIDEEFFYDASDSILDIPQVQTHHDACDPHLDAFGNVCSNDWIHNPGSFSHVSVGAIIDQVVFTVQTMKWQLPDLDALLANFGWVGKNRIRDTLAKTSQYYKADHWVPMRKHFRSRFPGTNVHHLPEQYATDTFIADVLAHDDGVPGHGGCMMAQIYGGLDSELLSGHPMV